MPMARMAGGSGTGAWRRTASRWCRGAAPAAAASARRNPSEPSAKSSAMVGGRPGGGSRRSRISSPRTRPGRGRPSAWEKLASRSAPPPPPSADLRLRLEGLPVLRGVAGREGADELDGTEDDGADADEHDEGRQGRAGVPDTEEAQGD